MDRVEKLVAQMNGAVEKGRPEIALSLAAGIDDPGNHAPFFHVLGVAYAMRSQFELALENLEKASSLNPYEPQYLIDCANVWVRQDQHSGAIPVWKRALKLINDDIGLWHFLAQSQIAINDHEAALDSYRQALDIEPEHPDLWCNLAAILKRLGRLDQSLDSWQKALKINPESFVALAGFGAIKVDQREYKEARRFLEKSIQLEPGAYEPRGNLILVALAESAFDEAMEHFEKQPDNWQESTQGNEIHGAILDGLGRQALLNGEFERAEELIRLALQKNEGLSTAWFNLGQVLRVNGDWEEAIAAYEKSAAQGDEAIGAQIAAWLTLPILYRSDDEITQVRQRFGNGLDQLESRFPLTSLKSLDSAIDACTGRTNFQLAYQQKNDLALQKQYGAWVSSILAQEFEDLQPPRDRPRTRIRVGFVSSFWWRHTVGKLFRGWVEDIDHDGFEVIVYHLGTRQDEVTQALALAADTYVNIQGLRAQVKRIREDAPDVLIYPEVGMDGATMALAALRLAPVQCVSWGHPVTTGLPTMDYFLTSEAMEPVGSDDSYSETLIRLPELSISYSKPELPALERTRADFGLPQNKVLYLCCQSLFKYLPENDDVWVDIKKGCMDAHFVFINNKSSKLTERFKTRLGQRFTEAGLDLTDCSTFVGPLQFEDYLQLNGLCDIYLDSLGWSGGNTSLEALAWSLPMVTWKGEWMRGRHTAAILDLMSMSEWVADDRMGYAERAIMLGEDPEKRREVREMLKERCDQIYSKRGPVRALETFLRKVSTRK